MEAQMSQARRARLPWARAVALAPLFLACLPSLRAEETVRAKERGHKLGPVRLTPVFSIPYLGVDTNVFNRPYAEVPDSSGVISGALGAQLSLRRRLLLDGTGQASVNYFRRQETEQFTNYSGALRSSAQLRRLDLSADVATSEGRDRFDIEIDERLKRRERRAHAGAQLAFTRKLSASLRGGNFRQELLEGDRATKQALNREEISAMGELLYSVTSRTIFAASSALLEDRFFSQGGIGPRRARSYRHLIGLEFSEKAAITGSLRVGVRTVPSIVGPGGREFSTFAASGRLVLPLSTARIELSGERDFYYSAEAAVGAEAARSGYLQHRLRLDVVRELPFGLIGIAAVERAQARHPLAAFRDGFFFRRGDNQTGLSASVLAPLGHTLKAGATISWTRRLSNAPLASYEGLRYGVTAEWKP